MWFIWIMWVIVAIAIIATIILLTGKGSMLVSGFNTKSPEERAKYDKEKVSKQTGLLMIFVDVGLLALTSYIQFRAIPAIQNITISDYGTYSSRAHWSIRRAATSSGRHEAWLVTSVPCSGLGFCLIQSP